MMRLSGGTMLVLVVLGCQIGVVAGTTATSPAEATVEFDSEAFVVHAGGEDVDLCTTTDTTPNETRPAIVERNVTSGVVELDRLSAGGGSGADTPAYCSNESYTTGPVASHPANVVDWSPDYAAKNVFTSTAQLLAMLATPVAKVVYHTPLPDRAWPLLTSGVTMAVSGGYLWLLLRGGRDG